MNETKATRYQRLRRRAKGAGFAAGAIVLTALTVTSGAKSLDGWTRAIVAGWPALVRPAAHLSLFVMVICGIWEAIALPVVLYLGLHVERRYRKTEHTTSALVISHLQSAAISAGVALTASVVVRASMWLAGSWWWVASGIAITAGLVAALRAAPALVPLAGELRPIASGELTVRLSALAREARVPLVGLYELRMGEAEQATAFIAGIGQTRRAVVSESLAREWTEDEVEVVLAHELLTRTTPDLWRTLALDALILSAGLYAAGRAAGFAAHAFGYGSARDLAALPLLALIVGAVWMAATPVRHWQSRRQERRADRFALRVTGHIDAFATAVRRMSAQHLAEERPSRATRWLYHRHPTVDERLAFAASMKTTKSKNPTKPARERSGNTSSVA